MRILLKISIGINLVNDYLSVEFGVWRVELMVATLRSYNSVCCLDKFVR